MNHTDNKIVKPTAETNFPHDLFRLLTSMYGSWGSTNPPAIEKLIADSIPQIEKQENDIYILKRISGSPRAIFAGLELEGKDLLHHVTQKIKNSNEVALFGAAGPVSIYDVACFLNIYDFKGNLEVIEIAEFPLTITQPYVAAGNFALTERQFKLTKGSVLDPLSKGETSDLILADVLSYYISPEELPKLAQNVYKRLKPNGLYLSRDLVEPSGPPAPVDRSVSGRSDVQELHEFLKIHLDPNITLAEVENQQNNTWATVTTYPRIGNDEYTRAFIDAGLVLKQSIIMTTARLFDSQNPRIFYLNVFEKKC